MAFNPTRYAAGVESVRPANVRYTYAEYECIPTDARRWELIDGDLYVNPVPLTFHQVVSRRLQYALMTQLEQPGIADTFDAPVDVILSDHDVVQPDLVIIAADRRNIVSQRGIDGRPDIVVEILSPSNRAHDRVLKRATYAPRHPRVLDHRPGHWPAGAAGTGIRRLRSGRAAGPRLHPHHPALSRGLRAAGSRVQAVRRMSNASPVRPAGCSGAQ